MLFSLIPIRLHMKKLFIFTFTLPTLIFLSCSPSPKVISVTKKKRDLNRIVISGLGEQISHNLRENAPSPKKAEVILTLVETKTGAVKNVGHIVGQGNLDLSGVPDGSYTLFAESSLEGFIPPPPRKIQVKDGLFSNLELKFQKANTDHFFYYWESDHQEREFEYSLNEDVNTSIEFLNETIETPQTTAAQTLQTQYNIILDNRDIPWSYNLASKLLKSVHSLPHNKLNKAAKFIITERELVNDIKFRKDPSSGKHQVEINLRAFTHASERMVKLNGKRGKFFSRRLFNALVHFFTDKGRNSEAVTKILHEKFGVTTEVSDYFSLTSTNEPSSHFQEFKPNELVKIINAFAEMPEGFYKIAGLRYLLRRLDGHPHPLYPEAAAVAWPKGKLSNSYIEFMDTAFISQMEGQVHRLILHEKSHFLWSNVLSSELRNDWIQVGRWFENPETTSGWSTYDTTSFVSAYAHAKNPNEDMAESIADYILNPNLLMSRSLKKFNFIEKRIMNGYRYVASVREDLTFEVLNLFPDYDYPGKIRRVEVSAKGSPSEDKKVTITIELTDKEGVQDSARHAFTRITSPNETFKDLYLRPLKGATNGHILRGTLTIPNTAKRGYWTIQNITVTDQASLERHEGIIDFGFKLYINNGVEDTTAPQYVANSMNITSSEVSIEGKKVFQIDVHWNIDEDVAMRKNSPVYANMISLDHAHLYRITSYGDYEKANRAGHVQLLLTQYHPPGDYGISYLRMQDRALNYGEQRFSSDPNHEAIRYVTINSEDADYEKPVLDPNRITVQAAPVNPQAPDGQTNVEITFFAKDNKSGLDLVYYRLLDPLGKPHFNYFYHTNTYTLFYKGNPTENTKYTIRKTLPRGSAPGKWGLSEIVIHDKAGNVNTYNFLETIHFKIID